MIPQNDNTDLVLDRLAIGVRLTGGGASAHPVPHEQYGRRIEADQSWTVYHVFTGIPASTQGRDMTKLDRVDATDGMLSLNRRSQALPGARDRLPAGAPVDRQ